MKDVNSQVHWKIQLSVESLSSLLLFGSKFSTSREIAIKGMTYKFFFRAPVRNAQYVVGTKRNTVVGLTSQNTNNINSKS